MTDRVHRHDDPNRLGETPRERRDGEAMPLGAAPEQPKTFRHGRVVPVVCPACGVATRATVPTCDC